MRPPLELDYWKSVLVGMVRPGVPVYPYVPERREAPARVMDDLPTAWKGIENILADLIDRFHLGTDRCLEFGVERGFSTAALSSYFKSVTGVDTFQGDVHTANFSDLYDETAARLARFDNIRLVRSDFRDFIKTSDSTYDLIHVDIIHTFEATFACGIWSARHSRCTIFHDTESFPAVKQAVSEVARQTGKKFYNFEESNGLGIVL